MINWQEDLLNLTTSNPSEEEAFRAVETSARTLGFDFCAYGLRLPFPVSNPTVIMRNNYPARWQARYVQANYLKSDPVVIFALKSQRPLTWTDAVFARTPEMWEEAKSFGLRVGWSQSSLDGAGVGGMLSLVRSANPLSDHELQCNELKMRWLVQMSHTLLSRSLRPSAVYHLASQLTRRELEVLKWTADGKTSGEISDILSLSQATVNFHVKNAVAKLDTVNKTSAVVRAAMLGLLT